MTVDELVDLLKTHCVGNEQVSVLVSGEAMTHFGALVPNLTVDPESKIVILRAGSVPHD